MTHPIDHNNPPPPPPLPPIEPWSPIANIAHSILTPSPSSTPSPLIGRVSPPPPPALPYQLDACLSYADEEEVQTLTHIWKEVENKLAPEKRAIFLDLLEHLPHPSYTHLQQLLLFLEKQVTPKDILPFTRDYLLTIHYSNSINPNQIEEILSHLHTVEDPNRRTTIARTIGKEVSNHPQSSIASFFTQYTHAQASELEEHMLTIQSNPQLPFLSPKKLFAIQQSLETTLETPEEWAKPVVIKIEPQIFYDISRKTIYINPEPSKLSEESFEELCDYIARMRNSFQEQAHRKGHGVYIPARDSQLARGLHFTAEGKVLIHFTKKSQGDKVLGKGSIKRVCYACDIDTGIQYASASTLRTPNPTHQQKIKSSIAQEIKMLQTFSHEPGFLQLYDTLSYPDKHSQPKRRLLFKLADTDLCSIALENKNGGMTYQQKQQAITQLITRIATMHEKGILHRDIKADNILVSYEHPNNPSQSAIELLIGDLGGACAITDVENLQKPEGTEMYMAPEYQGALFEKQSITRLLAGNYIEKTSEATLQKIIQQHWSPSSLPPPLRSTPITPTIVREELEKKLHSIDLAPLTTEKLDAYAVGMTLFAIAGYDKRPKGPPFSSSSPDNIPIQAFIAYLTQPNPTDRISVIEARNLLPRLDWSTL